MRVMKGHIGQIVFLRFCILFVQFFVRDIVLEIIREAESKPNNLETNNFHWVDTHNGHI